MAAPSEISTGSFRPFEIATEPMPKKNILLLIETSRGFGRGLIRGISRYSLERGNWSLLFQDRGMLDEPQSWLRKWKGDGIIARSATPEVWHFLRRLKIPVVELLGDEKDVFGEVVLDNGKIGQMAAEHFVDRNFRHFAFFSPENWWWSVHRKNGFVSALETFGCDCTVYQNAKKRDLSSNYSLPDISEITGNRVIRWLKRLPKPVGLFVVSDLHAVYILEACKRAGLDVPEEIAILGMDNDVFFCQTSSPQLSSIDPNTPLMGYEAARRLDRLMDGSHGDRSRILIPPSFVATRQTTDIIAVDDPLIAKVLTRIRENATTIVSVHHLAREFGMSSRTLERRFKAAIRHSPEEELIRVRLERAKTLLRDTKLSVAEIALLSGFSDPSYFIRLFRQKCRTTPNRYRKEHSVGGPNDDR